MVIMQEIEICPGYQLVYVQVRIHPKEWGTQNSLRFSDSKDKRQDQVIVYKK